MRTYSDHADSGDRLCINRKGLKGYYARSDHYTVSKYSYNMPRLALSEGGAAQLCVGRLYSFMSRFMYVNALSILPIGGLLKPRTSHQ